MIHNSCFVGLQGIRGKLGVLHVSSYLIHLSLLVLPLNLHFLFIGAKVQNVAHFPVQFLSKLHGTSTHLCDKNSFVVGNEFTEAESKAKTRNSTTVNKSIFHCPVCKR